MTVLMFFQIVAAVILGCVIFAISFYGIWLSTRIERQLGIDNGGEHVPFWVLVVMAGAGLLVAGMAATLV